MLFVWLTLSVQAHAGLIKIGVRAHNGVSQGLQQWKATADYLTEKIPEHEFIVVPVVNINDLIVAVSRDEFDFVLANPSMAMELEVRAGITPLVTLINKRQGKPYTKFGSVIFTRADRTDINTIKDLKKKSFIAVSPKGFGGWLVARREILKQGVNPEKDFTRLAFSNGIQEDAVTAVQSKSFDAGVVRTDMLERLEQEGKIRLSDFKIINPQTTKDFPFAHSTPLYPEWPFSKLKKTSTQLAQKVALALLTMPKSHHAAKTGQYVGWTVVEDYQPVRELLKELKVGPYKNRAEPDFFDLIRQYWQWFVMFVVLLLISIVGAVFVIAMNTRLEQEAEKQRQINNRLEEKNQELNCLYQVSKILNEENDVPVVFEKIIHVMEAYLCNNNNACLRLVYKNDEYMSENFEEPKYKASAEIKENKVHVGLIELYFEDDDSPFEKHSIRESGVLLNEIAFRIGQFLEGRQAEIEMHNINDELENRVEERTRELSKAMINAENANHSKSRFMLKMSHELRVPLNTVIDCTRSLLKNETVRMNQEIHNQVAGVKSTGESILLQVDDILELANIEAGNIELSPEYIEIEVMMNEVISNLQTMADERKIKFSLNVSNNVHSIKTDREALLKILGSLGNNAIKFNVDEGQVDFSVDGEQAGTVIFSVTDSGPGIAADKKELLLNEFTKLERNSGREVSGVGLSIVKTLVKLLGGTVGVESIDGKGSRFWFRIPAGHD